MALIGVGLVVFNGSFILKINPLGDILSLTAALMPIITAKALLDILEGKEPVNRLV